MKLGRAKKKKSRENRWYEWNAAAIIGAHANTFIDNYEKIKNGN